MRGHPGAQRARILSQLLVAAGLFAVYLAFHALPCLGGHAEPADVHHVHLVDGEVHQDAYDGHQHDHPAADNCGTDEQPHHPSQPNYLAAPRISDASGTGSPALLLVLLGSLLPAGGVARCPRIAAVGGLPPRAHSSGQDVLRALCVLRR
ncbi:hypothetical protein ACPZ19_26355 [Amycolatopsis lurida]